MLLALVAPEKLDAGSLAECVKKVITPVAFSIAKGEKTATRENGHLASMRITLKGCRKVALMPMSVMSALIDKLLPGRASGLPEMPEVMEKVCLTPVKEVLASPGLQGQLWHGTVGDNDILRMPPGSSSTKRC